MTKIKVGEPMPYFCPACQAIPAAGHCKLAGCPTAADATTPSDGALGRQDGLAHQDLKSPTKGGEAERLGQDAAFLERHAGYAFEQLGERRRHTRWNRDVAADLRAILAQIDALEAALTKIDAIRNSIIGCQRVNFSEHVYPLVAALDEAGFKGQDYETSRKNIGTLIERTNAAEARAEASEQRLSAALEEVERLTPKPCAHEEMFSAVHRAGPMTAEDYDEVIADMRRAKRALVKGDNMGCAVCEDSGHSAAQCHHNALRLARLWSRATGLWQCAHCGYIATNDEECRAHFGATDEDVPACDNNLIRAQALLRRVVGAVEPWVAAETRIAASLAGDVQLFLGGLPNHDCGTVTDLRALATLSAEIEAVVGEGS